VLLEWVQEGSNWSWRSKTHAALGEVATNSPYGNNKFSKERDRPQQSGIHTGTSFGDNPAFVSKAHQDSCLPNIPLVNGAQDVDPEQTAHVIGSWGIKQSYLQEETPVANFPPINYKQYKGMLVMDDFLVKNIVAPDEEDVAPPFMEKQKKSKSSLKKEK
jgi:hypothetical protein